MIYMSLIPKAFDDLSSLVGCSEAVSTWFLQNALLPYLNPGSYLHPRIGGGTPPIDVNTHTHWGVCTVLVAYSYTA